MTTETASNKLAGLSGRQFEELTRQYARQHALTRRSVLGGALSLGALAMAPGFVKSAHAQAGTGTLRVARSLESTTLDPQKTFNLVDHEILWQVMDTLIYMDEKGEVYPGLALSWEFSNENKTVTFKLRPDVKFHDGTPFNAEAVVKTVARHRAPETASPNVFLLGPVDKVEAIDNLTVAYHYTSPFVPLWVGLGYSYCAPMSPTAIETLGDKIGRQPIGTGPFKLEAWEPDTGIRLVRNDEHGWATPWYQNDGKAHLEVATYVVIPEDSTRIAALQGGEVDLLAGDNAVPFDRAGEIEADTSLRITRQQAPSVFGIIFNQSKPPFDKLEARQAVNLAIDKEKIVALVLDGNGKPASSPLTSVFPQYNPATESKYPFDQAKAKELLSSAGLGDGFEFELIIFDAPIFKRVAEVVQADLAAVGIKMSVQILPVGDALALAGKGENTAVALYYTFGDPDILVALFGKGGGLNFCFAPDNADLQGKLDGQRLSFDAAERKDLVFGIQDILVDQAFWAPLYEPGYLIASRQEVTGISIDTLGFVHLQDLNL